MAAIGSVAHSVHPAGVEHVASPDFESLGKHTTTVDVARLQAELRALHGRLEFLETAVVAAAARTGSSTDHDGGEPASAFAMQCDQDSDRAGDDTGGDVDEPTATAARDVEGEATSAEANESGLHRSNAVGRKKIAALTSALQNDVVVMSERIDAMGASAKRREKAQLARERSMSLARSMEINRLKLAIEARVTSDDLAQAVGANADKLVALQSSVDSSISANLRKMQDVVQNQMASLLQMVQSLTQQQPSHGGRRLSAAMASGTALSGSLTSAGGFDYDSEGSDDRHQAFISSVTEVVQRLLRESEKGRKPDVDAAAFEALQEDHENLKIIMEEKADRQDSMATSLEDAQARLEEAEANIVALTAEMESTSQEFQESMELASKKQDELDELAQAASSLAADAHGECAATRALVGESRREGLLEARQEAEALAARAEGRAKAEVHKVRGEARIASENLAAELKRYMKRATEETEALRQALTTAKSLSEKATTSAMAAEARATDGETALQRAEGRLGRRLEEIIKNQTNSADETLERISEGETESSRIEGELRRLLAKHGTEMEGLRDTINKNAKASQMATDELRTEVKETLTTMVLEQGLDTGGGIDGPRGAGRGGGRRTSLSGGGGFSGGSNDMKGGVKEGKGNNGTVCQSAELHALGTMLRRQGDDMAQKVSTLQKSSVGIVTMLRRTEAGLQALATKELFWKAVDTKLAAHLRAVGDVCLACEDATVTCRSRITLPKEAQACLAGDMQRVAKLMAVKADYDVIRELAKLEGPEQAAHNWDERVEYLRQRQMQRFVKDCREALDRRAPELRNNFNGEEIREKFFTKLNDALKIALSKYAPTTPGATLFGKVKLKAKACVACDRPFTPSATGRPGPTPSGGIDGAGVEADNLPVENSHIMKDNFRPQTSHGRLGSPSRSLGASLDPFEAPRTSVHSVMNGDRSSPRSPHVFRGGFKLPKRLTSPLHTPETDDHAAFGVGHTSPLLHKSQAVSGPFSGTANPRPRTSGGTRDKGRPPVSASSNHPDLHSISAGPVVEDAGSIVSAFTTRTDLTRGRSGCSSSSGPRRDAASCRPEGRGRKEARMDFDSNNRGNHLHFRDDDTTLDLRAGHVAFTPQPGGLGMPYYHSADAVARPSTHDGILRVGM